MSESSVSPSGLRTAAAALVGLLALAGCATPDVSTAPASPPAPVAAQEAPASPLIVVPPSAIGTWFDLGMHTAPWLAGVGATPADGPSVPTRAAGLQRSDGHWLAIVLVQRVPGAGSACPPPSRLHVADAGSCLQMRRDADFDRWLQQQQPVLQNWIEARGWSARPRAWISDRALGSTDAVETVALVDPALLEPVTRNNDDFLTAGQSGLAWARQFASATQATAGGQPLRVPPFPYAAPLAAPPTAAPAPVPAVVTAPPPSSAVQVMEPPVRAPRADRQ